MKRINQSSPVWLQNSAAIVGMVVGAKHLIVDQLPGLGEAAKLYAGQWFDYLTGIVGLVLGVGVLFTRKKAI